jgi:hypothetical protein
MVLGPDCREDGQMCPNGMHHAARTGWIARRPSGTRREYVNWCHGTTSASMSKVTVWRSRWRRVIKPAYSVPFLLSINIFVWQNVHYFPTLYGKTFITFQTTLVHKNSWGKLFFFRVLLHVAQFSMWQNFCWVCTLVRTPCNLCVADLSDWLHNSGSSNNLGMDRPHLTNFKFRPQHKYGYETTVNAFIKGI